MTESADVGVVGLAVMGANLALNLADAGNTVAVYNRTTSIKDEFLAGEAADKRIVGATTMRELVDSLDSPKVVLLMVKAGAAVDHVIGELAPLLSDGDIIIDGGNSRYTDTARRYEELSEEGIRFIGLGVSGGEEGARYGPSLMPGGEPSAWPHVREMLEGIAAVARDGKPCVGWLGPGGTGHFVKMVHNGIEYGDMQVIAEAYDLMRRGLGMSPSAIGDVFESWNTGRLESFLIEITSEILRVTEDGEPLIDKILDAAAQKGTGAWTVVASMELSEPTSLVAEAVYARIVSSEPERRRRVAALVDAGTSRLSDVSIDDIEASLYASKIISYAQGFRLLDRASRQNAWGLDLGLVASLWRAGCIIRAAFLEDITEAYAHTPDLPDLIEHEFFISALKEAEPSWRRVVSGAIDVGVPAPAYSSALGYFDSMRSPRLPADLIQAQRDYFGAHTFERVDRPRGESFHHEWSTD